MSAFDTLQASATSCQSVQQFRYLHNNYGTGHFERGHHARALDFDRLIQENQTTMLVDRCGCRFLAEVLTIHILARNAHRYAQPKPQAASLSPDLYL